VLLPFDELILTNTGIQPSFQVEVNHEQADASGVATRTIGPFQLRHVFFKDVP
jgi:hypothetical protein